MITQHGVGAKRNKAKATPPLRYGALEKALDALGRRAARTDAAVHCPKVGAGLAGGDWGRILPLIQAMAQRHGVDIYVYELPPS
jgi:hypothetical protein